MHPTVQLVSIAFTSFTGRHFQGIFGSCSNVSQNAARLAITRATAKLLSMLPAYIQMPTVDEIRVGCAQILLRSETEVKHRKTFFREIAKLTP